MQIINGSRLPTITDTQILGFFGEFRPLSNFHICPVTIDGITYGSSEAAFMSLKNDDPAYKLRLANWDMAPKEAKKLGGTVQLRPDWEYYRVLAMQRVVFQKFLQNSDIRVLLLDTGNKYLEETNNWGDKFWGVENGEGLNMLGKVLMSVRSQLHGVIRKLD